ncbi:hypothetical protein K8Z49_05815 [Actinomadura madurae]|uniref:hypothetical protein n=1 Tax=Actinomadura madurae TaxID=1993 RepID=UPI0011609A5B|nr:hypothetical protein [Actinomadura madurae]
MMPANTITSPTWSGQILASSNRGAFFTSTQFRFDDYNDPFFLFLDGPAASLPGHDVHVTDPGGGSGRSSGQLRTEWATPPWRTPLDVNSRRSAWIFSSNSNQR